HRAVHHARLRVPTRRCAPHQLPPAAIDAARARDGVRRDRRDTSPLRARDRGALSLLLLRRCDADPLMFDHVTIRVSDLEASRSFYATVFDRQPEGEDSLEWDDFSIATAEATRPPK